MLIYVSLLYVVVSVGTTDQQGTSSKGNPQKVEYVAIKLPRTKEGRCHDERFTQNIGWHVLHTSLPVVLITR